MKLSRRHFNKTIGLASAAFAIGGSAHSYCRQLPKAAFGQTGLYVSRLGFSSPLLHFSPSQQEADHTVRYLLDAGLNYFDTSPYYGAGYAETLLGKILHSQRDNAVIATKTRSNDKKYALLELEESLKRLQTRYVDVWILDNPNVNNIEKIVSNNGVMAAAIQAKEQGKCRFIGISGQYHPQWTLELCKRYSFDVVQLPLNAVDPHYLSFAKQVLPELDKNKTSIVGCKTYAMNTLRNSKVVSQQAALQYALSLPVSVTLVSCTNKDEARQDLSVAFQQKVLTKEEKQQVIAQTKPLSTRDTEWYKAIS